LGQGWCCAVGLFIVEPGENEILEKYNPEKINHAFCVA